MSYAYESITLPSTPGAYGVRLLARELLLGGLEQIRGDVLPDLPEELRPDFDGFQQLGRFADVGAPFAEMHLPPNVQDTRAARARSAHTMVLNASVAYTGIAMPSYYAANDFFQNTERALAGNMPNTDVLSPRVAAIVGYAHSSRAARFGLDNRIDKRHWTGDAVRLFGEANAATLDQLAESATSNPNPDRLRHFAENAGAACVEMAALCAINSTSNSERLVHVRQAARAFGAYGFVQEQGSHVPTNPKHYQNYLSAYMLQQGVSAQSLRDVHNMREEAERKLFDQGMEAVANHPSMARRLRTLFWFSRNVYVAQRVAAGLQGPNTGKGLRRIEASLTSAGF